MTCTGRKGVTLIPVLDGSVSTYMYVRSLEEFSKHQGAELEKARAASYTIITRVPGPNSRHHHCDSTIKK